MRTQPNRLAPVWRVVVCMVLFGAMLPLVVSGQITFHITELPEYTPGEDPIYITGNFNEWQTGQEEYRLARLADGTFSITLSHLPDTVEYKFTRGHHWTQVEANQIGYKLDNRTFFNPRRPITLSLQIAGWEDIKPRENIEVYVDRIPANTPAGDAIYITGNFNEWNPGDPDYRLQKLEDGRYYIRLPFVVARLEYKFARGTWESVESNEKGELLANRFFLRKDHPSTVLHTEILGWEDLPPPRHYTVTVKRVPENTPYDATLFLAGNFNDWNPGDPAYRMQRDEQGQYSLHFSSMRDSIYFKVTRGNWSTVEGRRNGQALPNRSYYSKTGSNALVLQVQSWEDMAGGFQNPYTIALLISGCLCLLMILAFTMRRQQEKSHRAADWLLLLLILLTTGLGLRMLFYFRGAFQHVPAIILVTDFIYFLYAPIFYLYIRKLIGHKPVPRLSLMLHFIPFALQVIVYLPLFVIPQEEFIDAIVDRDLHWIFATSGVLGFLLSTGYYIQCVRLVKVYYRELSENYSSTQESYYLQVWLGIHGLLLLAWATVLVSGGLDLWLVMDLSRLTELSTDFGWIIFSSLIYVLIYYSVSQPQVFTQVASTEERSRQSLLNQDESEVLKSRLRVLMKQEAPYLNPGLTLQQLADLLEVNAHLLSRIINEGYGKNFYDFVNDYRVREFIRRAEKEENQHLTFLAIAMDVGFSSKSTFNRAFKKVTETTPREYFRYHQEGSKSLVVREGAG